MILSHSGDQMEQKNRGFFFQQKKSLISHHPSVGAPFGSDVYCKEMLARKVEVEKAQDLLGCEKQARNIG